MLRLVKQQWLTAIKTICRMKLHITTLTNGRGIILAILIYGGEFFYGIQMALSLKALQVLEPDCCDTTTLQLSFGEKVSSVTSW